MGMTAFFQFSRICSSSQIFWHILNTCNSPPSLISSASMTTDPGALQLFRLLIAVWTSSKIKALFFGSAVWYCAFLIGFKGSSVCRRPMNYFIHLLTLSFDSISISLFRLFNDFRDRLMALYYPIVLKKFLILFVSYPFQLPLISH